MPDYDQLAYNLRKPLSVFFPAFSASLDLGRGTAMPTAGHDGVAVQADSRFFRTDLGFATYYDGTRWLTVHEYSAEIRTDFTQIAATNNFVNAVRMRTDYAPSISRIAIELFVTGTSNATNYWTIGLYGYNTAFGGVVTIDLFDTKAVVASTWTPFERVPNTSSTPSSAAEIVLDVTKTLAPGNLQILETLYYRLIVT